MRIGFTGASGQGKTSVAENLLLVPEFYHYNLVRSTSRTAADNGYPINEDATMLSQLLITASRISAELMSHKGYFISERTPLDSLAYTQTVLTDADDYYMSVTEQLVEGWMRHYSMVFYFPLKLEVTGDKYRSYDTGFHEEVDERIRYLLKTNKVNYHELRTNSVKERVEEIRSILYPKRYT